jgi:hypothetical protein
MDDHDSLNHTKWDRKYHVVFMLEERTGYSMHMSRAPLAQLLKATKRPKLIRVRHRPPGVDLGREQQPLMDITT